MTKTQLTLSKCKFSYISQNDKKNIYTFVYKPHKLLPGHILYKIIYSDDRIPILIFRKINHGSSNL